uniref:Putative membrane protein n=1 Tax=Klebsiella pneumoniae TaxID=573 RepID=U5N6P4_KLEPN|nr:putative membrane protein [Klebsiella pneumoniae]
MLHQPWKLFQLHPSVHWLFWPVRLLIPKYVLVRRLR